MRAWRRAAGWSQRQLAEHAGIHVQTVKYHERQAYFVGGWAIDRCIEAFEAAAIEPQGVLSPVAICHPLKAETCGAKTRAGAPCRQRPIAARTRCRLHGGKSTGPKTAEGRERIAEGQRVRRVQERIRRFLEKSSPFMGS